MEGLRQGPGGVWCFGIAVRSLLAAQDKSGLVSYQELDMPGAEVLAEFKPLGCDDSVM